MLETIYTADPQMARPRQFFALWRADLVLGRQLGWRLAVRNIQAQYRRSLLGYLWAGLPILATTALWVALNASGMLAVGATGIPYPAFVLINITLWQGFVDALFSSLRQMEAARSMLTKVKFARESLILAGIIEVIFTGSIRFGLLIAGLLWFGVQMPATILLAPLAILALVLLGTTLGVLILPVSLLYDDVQRGLVIACSLWLFITPVVYPPPTEWPLVIFGYVNPVTPLLVTARELMTTGALSQPIGFIVVSAMTLIFFSGGSLLYRLAIPHVIARISS